MNVYLCQGDQLKYSRVISLNYKSNNCLERIIIRVIMTEPQGLVFCVKDWSDTFCVTKTIQFLVSFALVLFLIHDFIIRFCKQRELNFFFIVYLQMMIALLSNCIFTLDRRIRPLQYIESYAYNIYFITIVYQVSRRLVQLKRASQYYRWIWLTVHGFLIFFVLFLTVTFIVRNIVVYDDCEETWFLVINLFGITLSIIMVIAGRFYTKFQTQKIEGMIQKNTKNPLPEVWKWIIINIVCQFFRFLRSFIFIVSPYNCRFSNSYTANQILGLMFDVFSFHVGMIATIFFFRRKTSDDDFSSRQFQSSIRDRIGTGHSKEIEMDSTIQKVQKNNNLVKPKSKEQQQKDQHRMTARMFINGDSFNRVSMEQSKLPIFSI